MLQEKMLFLCCKCSEKFKVKKKKSKFNLGVKCTLKCKKICPERDQKVSQSFWPIGTTGSLKLGRLVEL